MRIECAPDVLQRKSGRQDAARYGSRRRLPLPRWLVAVLTLLVSDSQAAALSQKAGRPQKLSVRWTPDASDTNKVVVEVSGLSAVALEELRRSNRKTTQWQSLLAVYAGQGDLVADVGLPPMIGAYRVQSGALRFEPQFPLEPDVRYRAIFHPDQMPGERDSGTRLITADFQAPSRESNPTTVVSQVYPSIAVLPENLLKFYIHFSAPMSRGHIYDHIQLRNETEQVIELPFLEIDEELWNPAMTRLTLFIDPGRIKRGVRPLEEVGPALEEGKRFTLVIDRAWRDGAGNPLKETFQKTFEVGPPDRDPPDPAHWKIQPPKSETREPLMVAFREPLDHALALRVIQVTDETGAPVAGTTALEDHERHWTFVPARFWRPGPYQLAVQTTIEDLAGNNIGKPFEVDLFEPVQRRLSNTTVKLPFEVR